MNNNVNNIHYHKKVLNKIKSSEGRVFKIGLTPKIYKKKTSFIINTNSKSNNKLEKNVSKKNFYTNEKNKLQEENIENEVDRFEVCSPGEYEICKAKKIDKNKILISGVYKTPEVIKNMALNDGIINFTIESMEQYDLIKNLNSKNNLRIMIRLTSGNQFGINKEDVEEIINKRSELKNITITGIQYFSGTQKVSLKNLKRELDYVDEVIKDIKEKYNFEFQEIEFGPGFPIQYFQNSEFDEETFLNEFSTMLGKMEYKGKKILEIGRSIAASCGKYITKVVDMKVNKGQNYAILDGGIHHLTYYGQSMAMKIPKCSIYPERENINEEKWNLFGSLCTINDILVKQFPAGNLKIGDVFIFENTGAYCMTEGISLFLSRQLPKVIKILPNGNTETVREHLDTYKINM